MSTSEGKALCNEYSMHPEYTWTYDLPGYDPCMNPCCRLHQADHGVFVRLFDLIKMGVKAENKQYLFDER